MEMLKRTQHQNRAGRRIGTVTLALSLMLVGIMFAGATLASNDMAIATEPKLSDLGATEQTQPVKVKKDKKEDEPVPEPESTEVVSYYAEGWVGPEGGDVEIKDVYKKDKTKLKFAPGALKKDTLVTMLIMTDHSSFVEFEFGPHTPKFGAEVQLDLSWAYLPSNVKEKDITLYYWNGSDWQPEVTGTWEGNEKKVKLYLDHFSRYYFERR